MEAAYWSFWTCFLAFLALQQGHTKLLGPKEFPAFLPQHFKNQDWSKMNRKLTTDNQKSVNLPIDRDNLVSNDDLCLTKSCITSAADILNSMDQNIDPCDDFYGYVCGSWIDNAILEEGQLKHSVMGDMAHENRFQVHKALMEPYDPLNVTEVEKMTKDFYKSKPFFFCNFI